MFRMMIHEITEAYFEPHRFYHNIHHIVYMLEKAAKLGWLEKNLITAIWIHDVVCFPGAKDNEKKSVEFLRKMMFGEELYDRPAIFTQDDADFQEISDAVMSTIDHVPRNVLAGKLIDLDLAILAEDHFMESSYQETFTGFLPAVEFPYTAYLRGVRKEYGFATDKEWAIGRTGWIDTMLQRRNIFWTEEFKELEKLAVTNLEAEKKIYLELKNGL